MAGSNASSTSSGRISVTAASRSRPNRAPMTDAELSNFCVSGGRTDSRRPTTCRMPSGRYLSPESPPATHRPPCWVMEPLSARWRSTSPTKKGLPPVSSCRLMASAIPASSSSCPAVRAMRSVTPSLVQSGERDPFDVATTMEVGQHRRERVGPVEVGVAVGPDDQQSGTGSLTTRCRTRSSVPRSDQWRSSTTSSTGRSAATAPNQPRTASNSAIRSDSGDAVDRRSQIRDDLGKLGHQAHQLPARDRDRHSLRLGQLPPEGLDEGLVGDADQLVAPSGEHRHRRRRRPVRPTPT